MILCHMEDEQREITLDNDDVMNAKVRHNNNNTFSNGYGIV